MKRCDLSVVDELDYGQVEGAMEAPVLPLLIFRRDMRNSAKTLAIVDTGLDEEFLISKDVRDTLLVESGSPGAHEALWAGVIDIPCKVYSVSVKILDRWLGVRAYAPIYSGYENLIGRPLLNTINLCLRGPAKKVCVAAE